MIKIAFDIAAKWWLSPCRRSSRSLLASSRVAVPPTVKVPGRDLLNQDVRGRAAAVPDDAPCLAQPSTRELIPFRMFLGQPMPLPLPVAHNSAITVTGRKANLTDPTGSVVAAAQNADLLYLQHIVAVHTPIRDGAFAVELSHPTDDEYVLAEHRAAVRGLPAPHLRIHSDVLVFAQPHVPAPAPPTLAASAFETGVLR